MPESKDWGELAVVSTLGLPSNTITLIVALYRLQAKSSYYSSTRILLPVCQVCGHDEVVLDNEASLLGVQDEPLNHLGRHQPLLRVQVGAIK